MAIPAAIIGGSIITGAMGAQAQQQAQAAAMAAREQALQEYLSVNVPDPAQQAIILQQYKQTGQLTPEMEQAVNQRASELASIQTDPASREAELTALGEMTKIASSGGMDAQALQQEQQAINQANANEQGQIGAIVQNANARGTGGSGAALAAELQSTQNDANSSASAGMSAAAGAEQRALQAMSMSGQLGATINNQDYQQKANAAAAQDAINRFNAQNQQNVENTNVSTANQAQAANLANAQAISNANVGVNNQEEQYNKGLLQQQFGNEMQKASGEANALNGVASQYNTEGQTAANSWANIGSAINQGVAAIGKYGSQNNNNNNSDSSLDDEDNAVTTTSDNSSNYSQPVV